MSFLSKSPKLPATATATTPQQSSYKEAEPVGIGFGREMLGSHWLSDAFNWVESYGGANQANWQFASIAFALCAGPIDFIGKVMGNGTMITDLNYTFGAEEDYHDFTINGSMAGGKSWTMRVYRGTETQTADSVLVAGTGQTHPAYRGLAYVVMKNIDLGQGSTTMMDFQVEVGRTPPSFGSYTGYYQWEFGCNPFAAIYALLTETRGGGCLDSSLLDAAHWSAQAAALEATGVCGRTGWQTFCHPWFTQGTTLSDVIATICAYDNAYLYGDGGKLKVGWFPGGSVPGSLPTIAEADLAQKPSGTGFPDWSQAATSVALVYENAYNLYADGAAVYQAPANRETNIAPAPARNNRPFIHSPTQAAQVAMEIAAASSTDAGMDLEVLKSRAMQTDGVTPLMPGDLFSWNYGPHGLLLACRVTARRVQAGSASDTLSIIRERGVFPQPYVGAPDSRVPYAPVAPVDIADSRIWFLPSGFGGARQIAALVDRPAPQNISTLLHLSATGSAPWEQILALQAFAAKGALSLSLDGVATTVRVASTSLDWNRMQAQSALAQSDDTLLLLIDDEVVSVGSITVVSAGVYDLSILRGRQGTTAASHSSAAVAWLFYYDELQTTSHNEFYDVRTAGVYDSSLATKYFKFQAISADLPGDPKPDDPGISFVFPDLTAADASGVRTFTGSIAPTGDLRVGDLWYQTSGGVVVATYRWDGSAWVDVSDSRIAANLSAVQALIAAANADLADILQNAQDHVADLRHELDQRAQAIGSLQSAYQAADLAYVTDLAWLIASLQGSEADMIQEKSVRVTNDGSLASSISSLSSTVSGVSAAITTEQGTRASADSAMASSISSLSSTVSGMSANVTILAAAYVSGGQAVAMAGWNLDANGHAVSLTLITSSGPVTVSSLVLGGCDILSANFVAGTSGWRIRYDGSAEFQNVIVRGTLNADDIVAGTINAGRLPSGMLIGIAPDPVLNNPGSPNIRVAAPGSPPAGWGVLYSVGSGTSMSATSFPFTITTGGVNVVVQIQSFADDMAPGTWQAVSWNSLFL
jgi:hypothetical protein